MKFLFKIIQKTRILFLAWQANRCLFDKKDYNAALKKYKALQAFIKINIRNFDITEEEYYECSVALPIRVAEEMRHKNISLKSVPIKEMLPIRENLIKDYNQKFGEGSDKSVLLSILIDCSASEALIPMLQKGE